MQMFIYCGNKEEHIYFKDLHPDVVYAVDDNCMMITPLLNEMIYKCDGIKRKLLNLPSRFDKRRG